MRCLVLSDIHGNLPALQTVLQNAGSVDAVYCLGDTVGYGADPNACIDVLRALPHLSVVMGNHDAAASGRIDVGLFNNDARRAIRWTQRELAAQNLAWLQGLPLSLRLGDVTLVHGSPRDPLWEYLLDGSAAAENFPLLETPLCFIGHSHVPLEMAQAQGGDPLPVYLRHGERLQLQGSAFVNPGSVGQPRDHDPRASSAIFYPETLVWEQLRVDYDVAEAQRRIRAAGLPEPLATRLAAGW
jgi:diadenosine tetraphosphatase ApaH/serine/threonine PP2A family protein phosphatase